MISTTRGLLRAPTCCQSVLGHLMKWRWTFHLWFSELLALMVLMVAMAMTTMAVADDADDNDHGAGDDDAADHDDDADDGDARAAMMTAHHL